MTTATEKTNDTIHIRPARLDEAEQLQQLIARSIRQLGAGDYSDEQIEAALLGAFGLDTQLLEDQTYFVITDGVEALACGGWSKRRTLFGSDQRQGRDNALLDPAVDAAKIRAFFVAPQAARRGYGSWLLQHCEDQARAQGFRRVELMATLPGLRLYAARGYQAGEMLRHPLNESLSIEFVPMSKALD